MMNNYILNGKTPVIEPVLLKWAEWFEKAERHIAKTKVGEANVSTIFLGIDHNFTGGIPILFETMVFGGKLDQEEERYATWEEAERGHKEMVKRVKEAQ